MWHRKRIAQAKKGAQRYVEQRVLGVAFGKNMEELESQYDYLKTTIDTYGFDEKTSERLQHLLEETAANVFTGGTLTNSYAESVNNRIRRFKLDYQARTEDKIPTLRNFCKYGERPERIRFRPKKELVEIMDDEVLRKITPGVLATQQALIKKAKQTCTVIPHPTKTDPSLIGVHQTIAERNEECTWTLTWNKTSGKPTCSCNALVHNGMPCVHIVTLALDRSCKIPYSCFNQRFNKDNIEGDPNIEATQTRSSGDEQQTYPVGPSQMHYTIPDADSQHINAASSMLIPNDKTSIKIRGMIQMIEIAAIKLVQAEFLQEML